MSQVFMSVAPVVRHNAHVILVADRAERLDKFLARQLPQHSRTKLVRSIDSGEVVVDGVAQKPRFMLHPGMQVSLQEPDETEAHDLTPAAIEIEIVYEDAD